ncbi:MAG: hypothetical protein AB7G09_01320 [Pseudonocardia sp.]
MPVEDVAAVFGVGVIPVPEALNPLVGEGLVEHRTRGAHRVTRATRAELVAFPVVRGTLEQATLAAATGRGGCPRPGLRAAGRPGQALRACARRAPRPLRRALVDLERRPACGS